MQKENKTIIDSLLYDNKKHVVGFTYRHIAPNGISYIVINIMEKAWNEVDSIGKSTVNKMATLGKLKKK